MNHNQLIQKEFSKQAGRFDEKGLTLANLEYLQWIVSHLALQTHFRVLDVAAGTGHLSCAMAPKVEQVIALDATPDMLEQGKRKAEQADLKNITFLRGFAEKLPFPDNTFDRVICRFAVHHFRNPRVQVSEMVRVCHPQGQVAIIDLVSPEDKILAIRYNRLECLRDPSHVRALSATGLRNLLQESGLNILREESRKIEVHTNRWLDLTDPNLETRQKVKEELLQEINGLSITGMNPFLRDGELMFYQTWMIIVGGGDQ